MKIIHRPRIQVQICYGTQVAHYSCHRSRIAYLRIFLRWFRYGRVIFVCRENCICFSSRSLGRRHCNYTNARFDSPAWRKILQYLRRMALIAFEDNKKFNLASAINCMNWAVCLDLKTWKMLFSFWMVVDGPQCGEIIIWRWHFVSDSFLSSSIKCNLFVLRLKSFVFICLLSFDAMASEFGESIFVNCK